MAEEWNRRFCHLGRSGQGILLCPFTAKHQVALAIEIISVLDGYWHFSDLVFFLVRSSRPGHFRIVELHRNPDPMLKLSSRTEKGSARFIFLTPELSVAIPAFGRQSEF
jgi:hypothetical protein